MDQDRKVQLEKKMQEREFMNKMLIENEKNQEEIRRKKALDKEADIKMQENYAKMLDQ